MRDVFYMCVNNAAFVVDQLYENISTSSFGPLAFLVFHA